jgi:hypothetical protein
MGDYLTLLLVVMLVIPILLLVEPTKAKGVEIPTSCVISVNDTVEGQPITATIQMSPATPTGEGYSLLVYLKSPNGVGASSPNGPWVYHVTTDTNNRATATFNVPTYSGKWYVFVNFGGNTYANNSIFYSGGVWQTEFTISPIETPTPSPTATATGTPIPKDNPTPTPTVPEFASLTIPFLFSIMLATAGLLVYYKRKVKTACSKKFE